MLNSRMPSPSCPPSLPPCPAVAVTSTGSAELIAVSSLFSYDLYRTYFNPKATGKQIIRISRYVM